MNFTLTLTGENPSELAQFFEALAGIQSTPKQKTRTLPLGIVTDTALAHLAAEDSAAANGTLPPPPITDTDGSDTAAVAPLTKTIPTTKRGSAPRGKKTEEKAPVVAVIPPDDNEDFGAAFGNGAVGAATESDYDYANDLGEKQTGWTVEEVREKAKELVNAGKQLQLREHLNAFGAASISMLESANYDAFMVRMNAVKY